MKGFQLPADSFFSRPKDHPKSLDEYVANLEVNLAKMHVLTRKNLKISRDRLRTGYELISNNNQYKEADKLWPYNLVWRM